MPLTEEPLRIERGVGPDATDRGPTPPLAKAAAAIYWITALAIGAWAPRGISVAGDPREIPQFFAPMFIYATALGFAVRRVRPIGRNRIPAKAFAAVILHAALGAIPSIFGALVGPSSVVGSLCVLAFFAVLIGFVPGLLLHSVSRGARPYVTIGYCGTGWLFLAIMITLMRARA